MKLDVLRSRFRTKILQLASECNAENIRVFGSIINNNSSTVNDIDFLVHMKPGSGFCLGGLQWRLEELLGMKVDVVPDTSIHPAIRDKIINEAVQL